MINEKSKHDEEFLKSVKDQLYGETFMKDFPKYSSDRVETLVKMIELDERSDEEEAEECHANFDEQFLKITANSKKDRRKANFMKTARTVAAMLVIVLLADVTSHAVMDESLFHVLNLWANQIAILPGESEEESISIQEYSTQEFDQVEEFAKQFDGEFLVCSWLPEGTSLKKIVLLKAENSNAYLWEYDDEKRKSIISIQMYQKVDNELAGLTGTEIEDGEKVDFSNGISTTICDINSSECAAVFEYSGWWYLVYTETDKELIESVIGGMIKYE